MVNLSKDKKSQIINAHAHVFTIDHVPNEFGKALLPWPLYKIFTINFVKWYFKNFTKRGNKNFRFFYHRTERIVYRMADFLKWTRILWIVFVLTRMFIQWVFSKIKKILGLDKIFNNRVKELMDRFLTMARYSIHYKNQASIFRFLKKNYPPETSFTILSMDMEYMCAGKPRIDYLQQLDELIKIKRKQPDSFLPFVFLDPRRLNATKNLQGKKNFCNKAKSLLRKKVFNGIKLYPALGYYPFDRELIPMYQFAQEYEIPIMAHCIPGIVFYRGRKKKEWEHHPILEFNHKSGDMRKIPLKQKRNSEWTTNFTHPLNYHCLLDPQLLGKYLNQSIDLSKLKICLAHFGGTDQWEKYQKDVWNDYNNNISPVSKSQYLERKNTLNHGSRRTIWWNSSWLSIIYDLLIQYENLYSDVSYILYNEKLFPLLKYILQDSKICDKILFGTDFYVVSQKEVDKNLYHNLRSYLGEDLFMMIARDNPQRFLKTKFN